MTATDVAPADAGPARVSDLAPAFGRLATAATQAAVAKLSTVADGWIRDLEEHAESEGASQRAGLEALKAHFLGKNPVWAALKGAWWGASPQLRLVAVLLVLLVLLLAPVVLVLLLLGLVVAAIIAGIKAATG
jgi:hypothetical protein